MCGIAGIVDFDRRIRTDDLSKMLAVIKHRGPDDTEIFQTKNVALGMNRLSVIDVAGGKQPVFSEDKKVCAVYNGEIYNFEKLRSNLIKLGHKFNSASDSEVIVHLYEVYGEGFLNKLEGMFAIALWDMRKSTLILARDRCGEKPLYYHSSNGTFIFASELKSFLRFPKFKKQISTDALLMYMALEYVPTPYSILRNVYKLEPGNFIILRHGNLSKKKYWDYKFNITDISFDEAAETLSALIKKSVEARLVSDVPLGVFLSGGIDSSTVAYFSAQKVKAGLNSFSVGFEDESYDESKYAKFIAKSLGITHHHKVFKKKEVLDNLSVIAARVDEPFADSSILPTFMLSAYAREKVTVALGGDGADELFGGYSTFTAHNLARFYNFVPRIVHNSVVVPLISRLPTNYSYLSLEFKIKRFLNSVYESPLRRNQEWLGAFNYDQRRELFLQEKLFLSAEESIDISTKPAKKDVWQSLTYSYLRGYLQDDILFKVDRASMMSSLEVRAPFLDSKIIDFANSLPINFKIEGSKTKIILKKAMKNKLPPSIINRKKHGFGVPISSWIRGPLKPLIYELLSKKNISQQGLFDVGFVDRLVRQHMNGEKDNRKELWTLAMFELWDKTWYRTRNL